MEAKDSGRAGLIAFVINLFLFLIKLFAGILSGSLAILSDAFNSFLDMLSYLLGFFSIRVASQGPDADHPFGHRRAEPLSALVIAIFTGILAFEILKAAADNLVFGAPTALISPLVFAIVVVSIIVKIASYFYLRGKADSSGSSTLEAMAIDSRNDIFASSIVLIGIAGVYFGQPLLDDAAAIFIAIYILYSGYLIARKNINYLMGASPDPEHLAEMWDAAASVKGIKRIPLLRSHYVGDKAHVEVGIVLTKKTKAQRAHDIGEKVQKKIEELPLVSRAFVHIDYE